MSYYIAELQNCIQCSFISNILGKYSLFTKRNINNQVPITNPTHPKHILQERYLGIDLGADCKLNY